MKTNWRTYKHPVTQNTIIEVTKGTKTLIVTLRPAKRKSMSSEEFKRLVKRLQEAIELYDEA